MDLIFLLIASSSTFIKNLRSYPIVGPFWLQIWLLSYSVPILTSILNCNLSKLAHHQYSHTINACTPLMLAHHQSSHTINTHTPLMLTHHQCLHTINPRTSSTLTHHVYSHTINAPPKLVHHQYSHWCKSEIEQNDEEPKLESDRCHNWIKPDISIKVELLANSNRKMKISTQYPFLTTMTMRRLSVAILDGC